MKKIAAILALALVSVSGPPVGATYRGEDAHIALLRASPGHDEGASAARIYIRDPDGDSGHRLRQTDTSRGTEDFNSFLDLRFQPGTKRLWFLEYDESELGFLQHIGLNGKHASMRGFSDYAPTRDDYRGVSYAFDIAPDGGRIAYLEESAKGLRVIVASTDGIGRRVLVRTNKQFRPRFVEMRWAPNGRRLAVLYDGDVWTVDISDGSLRRVTDFASDVRAVSVDWAPNGRRLVVQADERGDRNFESEPKGIFVMRPDGSNLEEIGLGFTFANPQWSPDGNHILFLRRNQETRNTDLWRMAPDGTNEEPFGSYEPDFSTNSDFAPRSVCTIEAVGPVVEGTPGDDVICGTGADETIFGGGGNDVIFGGGGADSIFGQGDADVLNGQGGDDLLRGGRGIDLLTDIAGTDDLRGGSEADHLFATDRRRDRVSGGPGRDRCWSDAEDEFSCERRGHD